MSLARALLALPDDRASRTVLRNVLGYLRAHQDEPVAPTDLAKVTGSAVKQVREVLAALSEGFVIDCQPDVTACVYSPNAAVATEVDRFLFSAERSHDKFRGDVERFRGSYTRRR